MLLAMFAGLLATGVDPATIAVAAPHPLITEVLYAVPTGVEGDANKDGVRHATGDEFVELVNPHDKPIQLLGYMLSDDSQGEKSRIRFVFPALELKPGGVVVVFNGYSASWSTPVGDTRAAPPAPSPQFVGAYVFTMRVTNSRAALNNSGDAVTLTSPAGKIVQRVRWGSAGPASESGALDELVPETSRSSVQRVSVNSGAAWRVHTELPGGEAFSPGRYDLDRAKQSGSSVAARPVPAEPAAPASVDPSPDTRTPDKTSPGTAAPGSSNPGSHEPAPAQVPKPLKPKGGKPGKS